MPYSMVLIAPLSMIIEEIINVLSNSGVVYLWSKITFYRYCIVLVDLDKNQELGTEAYAYFKRLQNNLQTLMAQQTGLSTTEMYYEFMVLTATSLLEVN
jgi:hypothetical protein